MSDSEGSEVESSYGLLKYSLVRFVHKGRKRKVESVDLVPSKWLDFDRKKARCVTKYMEGPYKDEDLLLIQDLVKGNADAPEDWPTFTIEQVGRARTYEEGLRKLKELEQKDHVLTLESEDSASEAQRQFTIAVKRKKLEAQAKQFSIDFQKDGDNTDEEDGENFNPNTKKASKSSSGMNSESKSGPGVKVSASKSSDPVVQSTSNLDHGAEMSVSKTSYPVMPSTSKSDHGAEVLASISCGSNMVKPSSRPSLDVSLSSLSGCELSSLMDPLEPQIPDCNVNIDDMIMNAPIEMNNVEVKTPFEAAVLMRLDHLCAEVHSLRQEVSSLKSAQVATSNYLSDKKLVAKSTSDLKKKYNITLPLATYPEFQELENKLSSDNYFKQDLYIELKSCLDKDFNISKSIVSMLRRFLSKELALQFTAIRALSQNKKKFKFKPTGLCFLMEVVISKYRKDKGLRIEPEDFNNSLTDVIGNVSRWK